MYLIEGLTGEILDKLPLGANVEALLPYMMIMSLSVLAVSNLGHQNKIKSELK